MCEWILTLHVVVLYLNLLLIYLLQTPTVRLFH